MAVASAALRRGATIATGPMVQQSRRQNRASPGRGADMIVPRRP
jgi:hypothetical protein